MTSFPDTNVLVAAFATRGLCEDVLRSVLAEHRVLTSEFVLEELHRVLAEKLRMPQGEAARVCEFVRQNAEIIDPETAATLPERDLDDRWILAAAIQGQADVLVSGDRDLLEIEDAVVAIVSPRGFWERVR
ncbi:MAG: putative toxin-antitoxin system toxin component, PIN family [Woeseiaceae bacterium]